MNATSQKSKQCPDPTLGEETKNLKSRLPDGWRGVAFVQGCEPLWFVGKDERGQRVGMSSLAYREDGTLAEIIAALELALQQARFDMGALPPENLDRVSDGRALSGREVQNDIPTSGMSRSESHGEASVKSPDVIESSPGFESGVVGIRQQHDVALSVGVNFYDIVFIKMLALVQVVAHSLQRSIFWGILKSIFPQRGRLSLTGGVHYVRAGLVFRNVRLGNIAALAVVAAIASVLLCEPAYASRAHRESWYADALAAETAARTEVRMPDGTRCDVLTETHAVEVEFASKWCESVGQSLNYAAQTGKRGAIALILESPGDERFLKRLCRLIAFHRLPLVVVVVRPVGDRGIGFENLNGIAPAWALGVDLKTPNLTTTRNAWRQHLGRQLCLLQEAAARQILL